MTGRKSKVHWYNRAVHIYFIRHGQSENNILEGRDDYRQKRTEDPGLTDLGSRQVEAVAHWFESPEGPRADVVYSSLHRRALQTGSRIAEAAGLEHEGMLEIHEGGGIVRWDDDRSEFVGSAGLSHAELQLEFPRFKIPENAHPDGWWRFQELESRSRLADRAAEALEMLRSRHEHEHVVLVSHYLFYVYFMRALLGVGDEVWFALHNCACSCLDLSARHTRVLYLNREDYLPGDLRSATPYPAAAHSS